MPQKKKQKKQKPFKWRSQRRRRLIFVVRVFLLLAIAVAVGAMWWFVILEPGQTVPLARGYTSHREFGWTGVEFQGFGNATVFVADASGHGVYGPVHGADIQYKSSPGGYQFTICRPASKTRVPVQLQVISNYHTVIVAPSGTHC